LNGKLGSLVLSTLMLANMFAFAFVVQLGEASFLTIHIRTDGSVEPATLLIQRHGDLYVLTGNIKVTLDNDGLVVERDNVVLDGAGYTIKGEKLLSYPKGICLSGRTNVTIRNVKVSSFYQGIFLNNTSKSRVVEDSLSDNSEGIRFYRSSYNDILSSTIEANDKSIAIYYSSNNTISANEMRNNSDGILLVDSTDCSIVDNDLTTCNRDGICLVASSNNRMIRNSISANVANGIRLDSSSNNEISENNVAANRESGIVVWDDSNHNTIVGNNFTANKHCGIVLSGTLGLYGSSHCIISENRITANTAEGIDLVGSSNNRVTGNLVAENRIGLRFTNSSNNSVYHNNLMNNTDQISTWKSTNFWDNGVEGNYWSTYVGSDPDADGIGDSPYVRDENDTDFHPLMNPYILGDVNHDAKVNIIDICAIAEALGTEPGDRRWNPHADLDENGMIDIADVVMAARRFRTEFEYP
jgi:parallel beta-helix repeat protein